MSKSWEQTGGHFWPILITLILPVLVMIGFVAMIYLSSDQYGDIGLVESVIGNIGVTIAALGVMAICMAIYSLLTPHRSTLVDVFE